MTTRQVGIRLKTEGKAEVKRDFAEVGTAGQEAGKGIEGAFDAATAASTRAEAAAGRQMAKWKEMAKAAREYQTQQEQQAKFNAILGVSSSNDNTARASASVFEEAGTGGLTKGQRNARLNLLRQGSDVFTTAAMGMNPAMIAIQQGPQILEALALSGVKASGSMAVLASGIGTVVVVLGALAAAQASYEAETVKLTVATQGLGAASGVTAEQLEAAAEAGARAGEMNVRAAREAGIAYVQTGRIGGQVLDELIGLTRRYALTTNQDAVSATKELGAAFADPAKGAADLNDKLHFLDASEQRHIENLARAGHEAEAQALLVDKLQASLLSAADATTGWGHALEGLKTAAINGFDAVGRYVDGIITGGNAVERLSKARVALKSLEGQGDGPIIKELRAKAQAEIDQARKDYVAEMDNLRDKALNQRSQDRRALVERYNPKDAKLAGLKADREKLVGLGVNDAASKAALKELDDQIKALGAGYKTAAEQAAALAREQRRAAAAAAKGVREQAKEAREAAEAERKFQDLKTQGLRGELEIARALNDPSAIDYAERQLRIQQLIGQMTRDNVPWAIAYRDAQKQVAEEMVAEFQAVQRAYSNAELAKDQFVTSGARVARAEPGPDFVAFNEKQAFYDDLRWNTRDALHDGLVAGFTGGNFLEIFADRLKYAAATSIADAVNNATFGKKDGSSPGWLDKAVEIGTSIFSGSGGGNSSVGHNANGTDFWRGGLTWVGENGAELLDVPKGSQIHNHQKSMAMADAHQRATAAAQRATATYAAPSRAPHIEFHNHGPPLREERSQTADGRTRIDLYEDVVRPGIKKAGADGTLRSAGRRDAGVRRYG